MRKADIDRFVLKYSDWIDETMERKRLKKALYPEPTEEELPQFKKDALQYLTKRVEYYSELMGLYPSGIKITSGQKRLGSCNRRKGICFSWRLMDYPPEAIDYVVVHELAHIRHHNHSPAFYELVASVLPDYKKRQALLRP